MSELAELTRLGQEMSKAHEDVKRLELELKAAQKAELHLKEHAIPELMAELGMAGFLMDDGYSIEIGTEVHAKIAKCRAAEAHAWLEENGHGGMIRRKVITEFNREQEADANELTGKLRSKYPAVTVQKAVHSGTLKSWAKRMLEDGEALPEELFGIYVQNVAKLKRK